MLLLPCELLSTRFLDDLCKARSVTPEILYSDRRVCFLLPDGRMVKNRFPYAIAWFSLSRAPRLARPVASFHPTNDPAY